jgi:hypothetical protein
VKRKWTDVPKVLLLAMGLLGCGSGDEGFVDFDQTPASQLDAQQKEISTGNPSPDSSSVPGSSDSQKSADPPQEPVTDALESTSPIEAPPVQSSATPDSGSPAASAETQSKTVTSTQTGLVGTADAPVIDNAPASVEVREIRLLIPRKSFRRERGTEAIRVTYDDIDLLKVLNMEPVPVDADQHFPEWLKALDGRLVRIRGFMFPTFEATGVTSFLLARDNGICCFVRKPKIYDIIWVAMAEGETTDYIDGRPFDVEGIFEIDPSADVTELSGLYRIRDAKVLSN